jgi:hypothetical protein
VGGGAGSGETHVRTNAHAYAVGVLRAISGMRSDGALLRPGYIILIIIL